MKDKLLLTKIPDSAKPKEDMETFGFYIYGGKYYIKEIKGKNSFDTQISNFVGKSLFHLVNGTNDSSRIIKLQRNTGETHLIEVKSSEMNLSTFETILKSKQCTFLGNSYELKKIFARWMDEEAEAIYINTLGWNREYQIYAFSNAIITTKGEVFSANDLGIADTGENGKYYLPAFGLANRNDENFETDRKFIFKDGELDFENWAKLYYAAFESNGAIAIQFLILSIFWDIVFDQVGFFPFLFLFGAYGTGKTTMVENLLRIFGNDYIGTPLNNATQVGLSRTIASRNNSIFYLKEYTSDTDLSNQDLLLTAYDGSGRATGIKTNDNRTRVAAVKSALILDGNENPTQKTSVLSRMVLLIFENNKFSDFQTEAFRELELNHEKGFGQVFIEIIKNRAFFQKHFKKTFNKMIDELKENKEFDFSERTLKHVALMLIPGKLFAEKLKFPFTFDELKTMLIENAIEQNKLLKQTDEITIFWMAFANGIKNETLKPFFYESDLSNNRKTAHYNLKQETNEGAILQIKLQAIYQEYVKFCKNSNLRTLDLNSLKMLLTSKSYKHFIPNNQKRKGDAYYDRYFWTCYQFILIKKENELLINGVELNM